MYVNSQTVITAAAVLAAVVAIARYYNRGYDFVNNQKKQDEEIREIRGEQKAIREEQAVLTYGSLACLKGLREQGCNGPVSEAIDRIEKHLNQAAHGQTEVKHE